MMSYLFVRDLVMTDLMDFISTLQEQSTKLRYQIEAKSDVLTNLTDKKMTLTTDIENIQYASQILSKIVSERALTIKHQIEQLVNDGLHSVFSNEISFKFNTSIKRNKTEYSICIMQNGVEGSQESFGGGVLAVISLTLRVIIMILTKKDRVLFLDESLAFVSEQHQEALSAFLRRLCDSLGFTIILISHQPKLSTYANLVYEAKEGKKGVKFVVNDAA